MQYFNLNNLIYDVSLLKDNIEKIDNWEYYGKGRARLGVCLSDRGTILHIGLTQPSGTFDFKKLTIQEITLVGTYCYTNKDFQKTLKILTEKKLGDLGWIEYRDLKKGSEAFDEIHNGTCVAPKIILIP